MVQTTGSYASEEGTRNMRIIGVSGSLNRESTNSAVLARAAQTMRFPDQMVVFETLDDLPHFSPDRDHDPLPPHVTRWRDAVHAADALVIATPEYAGGMPGALKNGLDWLVGSGGLYGKPAVVVSVAPSGDRGQRARDSAELTLLMQGAHVCDSFTVGLRRPASPDGIATCAAEVSRRAIDALTSGIGVLRDAEA